MTKKLDLKETILLLLSVFAIYLLAPSLDRHEGIFISTAFAIVNILGSKPFKNNKCLIRYLSYILISILTYFILFNDEPWNMIFHRGLYESSPWPLLICSLMMSVNGWILFDSWHQRKWYAFITLGMQIPIALFIGGEYLQHLFSGAAHSFHLIERYSGSWQVWQFEWMLSYYLPIFILSRMKKGDLA